MRIVFYAEHNSDAMYSPHTPIPDSTQSISGFIGLSYGPFMKAATYHMDEGVKQGDMKAMPNFCIGINQANKSTHDSLQEKGGVILSGADDTYILGPPQIVFPEVKLHEERLASISLKLNCRVLSKCEVKNE